MLEQHKNREYHKRQVFTALFVVMVAIIYLRISQQAGRLAADLIYDDVVYALDGSRRFLVIAEHGIFAFMRDLYKSPPHSLFSTLLALGAFAIGGLNDFSIYASNTLLLLTVGAFITYEMKHARRTIFILVLCVVFLSPIAYRTIHDFRPDIALGFGTAVMVWWFISGLVEDDPRLIRRAGYTFGACLLIKPTFFAHTLAIGVFLIFMLFFWRFFRSHELGFKFISNLREAAVFLGLGALISSPYYLANWKHTFQYFVENTRGKYAELWSFAKDTSILESLIGIFELTFPLLGYHLLFSVIAVVLCSSILFLKNARSDLVRIFLVSATALVSFAIVVIGRHKNGFFLASFQWMILFTAVYAIVALDQKLQGKARISFLAGCILALLLTTWMNGTLTHHQNSPESLVGSSWNQKIINSVEDYESFHGDWNRKDATPTVFVPFAGPVNAETLRWLNRRNGFNIDFFSHDRSDNLEVAISSSERSKYTVLPNEGIAGYYRWLPSGSIQSSLWEWVLSNRRFKPISSTSPYAHYVVYANLALFEKSAGTVNVSSMYQLEGFLDEEGPYPRRSLPRVRWMNNERAKLCVLNVPILPHYGKLEFRSDASGRLDVFDEQGEVLAAVSLTPGKFMDISFDYLPKNTKVCLYFKARIDAPVNPKRLLLFRKIEFRATG